MPRPKMSIAGVVTVGLVAATTLVLGALAVAGYSSYRSRLRAEFTRHHAIVADQLATNLALPLWNFDRGEVGKVIESAMRDDEVYGIVARSTGDMPTRFVRTRNDDWSVTGPTGTLAATGLTIEKRPIAVGGTTIGEVEVFATPKFFQAQLRQTLWSIVGLIGLVDLILVVGLYLLLWRTVLKPLQQLEQHALAVSDDDQARERLPRGPYLGELESVRCSIEKMIGMLGARYDALQQSESRHRALAESLRESEEKFSTAFMASPQPIILSELATGRILDTNEGFLRTYDCTRAEVIGRTTVELGVWADPAERDRIAAVVAAHGSLRNRKVAGRTLRGQAITVLVSCEAIRLRDRPCLLTIVDDITDQERAEAALRESEEKFAIAFRASPDPIFITDFESGLILEANEGFLRTYACTRTEAIGHSAAELGLLADPADRDRVTAELRARSSLRNHKVRCRTLRGEPLTVLLSAEVVTLGGRKCILTVLNDVTEQERTELALRESEEKFSKAFRSSPNAMAIAEMESGRYLDVNNGFERLFGHRRADVIGRTSRELGIWPEAASRDRFVERLRAHGAVRDLEIESANRRGEKIVYLLSAEWLELAGTRCIVSVMQDVTDRRRAEADHARTVARERQAREDFTRRLIASQEAERRRIAGELHDSLGQNLLLIKNRAHLALSSGTVPPDLHWQFESIQDMAMQAIAEVRQISHDLRPYQLDQLGLTRALGALVESIRYNTGFPFTHKLDLVDDVFAPEAATHVYRIVQESLNNILKHAHATKAHVALERDVRELQLTIEDDGRGFTPGALPPEHPDGGLGLKNIAERTHILRGKLHVDSAPNRGTRIVVTIPLPEVM